MSIQLTDAAQSRLSYPVWVGAGGLARLGDVVVAAAPVHRIAVVTDDVVGPLHAAAACAALARHAATEPVVVTVRAGEAHKTRESWSTVTDQLLDARCGRDTTIVALGGGVVGDLAGFVAATYLRGVPLVQVPTTLLAMVDASVGGKTAVDTPAGKNLVGAFHEPAAVLADPLLLGTLPPAEFRAGTAEALKHGVIASEAHFDDVRFQLARPDETPPFRLALIIAESIAIKAAVVADDLYERGRRKTLNFGHTVGHAVERVSGYALRHGEAVAVGMVAEARLAERVGAAVPGTAAQIEDACAACGLPTTLPIGLAPADVLEATRGDKKARGGRVEYALPIEVGEMDDADGHWALPVEDALVLETLHAMAPAA